MVGPDTQTLPSGICVLFVPFLARPSFEWFHSQAGSPHAVADVQESHRLLAQYRGPQTIALESKPT